MKKKILITWWLGYIGSHAVVAFEQSGYEIIILDNLSNSSDTTLGKISEILWYTPKFYKCELWNIWEIEKVFQKHNFDWVIHFAWLKSPFESQSLALKYFQNNISGSINLFDIMEKKGVKNIIFSSSANTYSRYNISPVKESDAQSTSNPYWTTKLLLEKILEDLSQFSWFNVINLRYFNPIGAHISWKLWENPDGIPNNLLPYIMKVVKGELNTLQIFWNDYSTIDGTWVRDYIDVNDLVESHILSYKKLEWLDYKSFCWVYNVWTWKWVSVLEMINIVEKTIWKRVNYEFVERRNWDIETSFCDTSKIKKELWFQTKTLLEKSILNSWNFIKNNM